MELPVDQRRNNEAIAQYAEDWANRSLLRRLRLTGHMRGAPVGVASGEGASLSWFAHKAIGLHIGLIECVYASPTLKPLQPDALNVLDSLGDIFKVSKVAAEKGGAPILVGPSYLSMRFCPRLQESLPLSDGYDATLASLGKHTRRNIRNVRKRANELGIRSLRIVRVGKTLRPEIIALASRTRPQPLGEHDLDRYEAYVDGTGNGFRSALRTGDGALLSYALGYFDSDGAHLVCQLNDHSWHGVSPSLLHRSYLIERFAESGIGELSFVHGCAGVLRHSCRAFDVEEVWLIRRSLSARLLGAVLSGLMPPGSLPVEVRKGLANLARSNPSGTNSD